MGQKNSAGSSTPKLLYKFYKFNSESLDSLVADYLWCSKPEYLNDPFEFKPPFKMTGYDEADMKKFLKLIREQGGVEAIKSFKREFPNWKSTPSILDDYLSNKLKKLGEKAKEVAACCFTSTYDNPVMLAHYCDNYTGFMVEYKTGSLAGAGDFLKVGYYPKGKEVNLLDEFYGDKVFSALAFKREEWAYENEYRLLVTSQNFRAEAGVRLGVDPLAYSKIIVPEQAPDSVKRTLFALADSFEPVVPLYECYADSALEFKLRELPKSDLPAEMVML